MTLKLRRPAGSITKRMLTVSSGSPFAHLIMSRAGIESAQQGPRSRRHHSRLIVGASEGAYGRERREPHYRDELHLVRLIASQEVDPEESLNRACGDPLEDLGAEETLVSVGILGAGPSMPDAGNHSCVVTVTTPD